MKSMKLKNGKIKLKANKYIYDFQKFEAIRSFGDNIYTGKISIDEAEINQSNLLENVVEFNNKTRPKKRR